MILRDKLYIDGCWSPSAGTRMLAVTNAATEEIIGKVPAGGLADVDEAVRAAFRAFESWAATSVAQRADALDRICAGLKRRADEIARTISAEVGMPLKLAQRIQAGLPPQVMASTAEIARGFAFEETIGHTRVTLEPVGVVACITPWNYPLHQVVAKLAPALAAGCTVVLKPSELAPLTAFMLAEMIEESNLPPGVFNLISGPGPVIGEALVVHPLVDMISFTGSTRAGKRISELAASGVKRVALELGGKSASVVLDDADFARAVKATVTQCYLNSGQTCTALSRLLVPATRHDEALRLAVEAARGFTPGDPLREETRLGPLISAGQRERVRAYIGKGIAEGATLATGGVEPPPGLDRGYFVQPTVFGAVRPDMIIAQEEIFGPVLCVIAYQDEEEAVRIANGTAYGLAAAVWSADDRRAERIARRLRAGRVDVNGSGFNMLAPFGGFKQSGHGRELGRYGIEEFLEARSLQLPA